MYYDIVGLCPRTDIDMGRHGFMIHLHPKWKGLVAAGSIDATKVARAIQTEGDAWLDGCGFGSLRDYGDGPTRIYQARTSIRVSWGEWGPEHISVPGNACGLDIDRQPCGNPFGGPTLLPHNIDSWGQVQLLLIVFTFFAETLAIQSWQKIRSGEI